MTQGPTPVPRRRIRLTYLITDLKVGGVPLHLYRLATSLPRERFDVQVISLSDEGPVGERLREAGVAVRACGARTVRQWSALGRLWRLLVDRPPDLLHSLLFHANLASRLVAPLAGVGPRRIINEIQTVEIERRWHLVLDGLTCRLCRFEIGNSPSVVDHLHRQAGIPRSRLRCEWGAVDVGRFETAAPADRAALGVATDESLLVWTGRLDPVKGFEEMIEAAAQLKERVRFKLLLAGEGAYRSVVEGLILKHGVSDRVVLLGRHDAVPSLLRAADLFVFPSRTEGLPNSLMEAMAAGLPVITSDVPGCRDLVFHGQTGLLVPPNSPGGLASAIDVLLADRPRASRLGGNAQAWIRSHAGRDLWVQRWQQLYADLVA